MQLDYVDVVRELVAYDKAMVRMRHVIEAIDLNLTLTLFELLRGASDEWWIDAILQVGGVTPKAPDRGHMLAPGPLC